MIAMANHLLFCVLMFSVCCFTDSTSAEESDINRATQKTTCGIASVKKSSLDNRIVGGNVSNIEYHPWFAALTMKENGQNIVACGATLITQRHLITAAHCYDGNSGGSRESRYNIIFNLQDRCKERGTEVKARQVIIHKKYGKGSDLPENDIAMIVLRDPVSITPICLPSKKNYDNEEAIIIGYGSTKVRSTYPCKLLEAKIKVYSNDACMKSGIGNNFAKRAICAGKMSGGVDACDGDSGGPLMVKVGDQFELIGVTSYGEGCGKRNYPGVYTDLTMNGQGRWIQKRLKQTGANGQSQSSAGTLTLETSSKPQKPSKPSKPFQNHPMFSHDWFHSSPMFQKSERQPQFLDFFGLVHPELFNLE